MFRFVGKEIVFSVWWQIFCIKISISEIEEIDTIVIGGHCLPFHIFGETPLNYKKIYEKLEDKILNVIKTKKNVVLVGDFNYTNIYELASVVVHEMIHEYIQFKSFNLYTRSM